MFSTLGISTTAEAVYMTMLRHSTWGVAEIAESLGVSAREVHDALDELIELALVRESSVNPGNLRPTSPKVGLAALLARAKADIAQQQYEIEATQAAIDALSEAHQVDHQDQLIQIVQLDGVRQRLEQLARLTQVECLSFNPGGAHRPDAMAASKPVNQEALERGVSIKSIYQESFRNDPDTLAYARWFNSLGGETRCVPVVLFQMVIVDRSIALLPVDPTDARKGAIEIHNPGITAALSSLFDHAWSTATPLGHAATTDENGLEPAERQLLQLLGDGYTDDATARKLGLSVRTVQRMMSDLTTRLGAESRFQAGANAVRQRWL
ncbi:Sugar-specific transcriptional regulator TrmB [Micromonospora phaseoli]|uniref:Sugar-specific transcriptional regulator TrmB n=1 Tax=Micromonospora phaseoli TaxID=1144548 RepID=A0A1H7CPF8_9ACTN|nr:helix-turn-helix domain-containing protein [Micromonospora phaseoli]PZV91667.1 sugar-specific transcriptional regulator TrmB [Micromonospora phaseoli]GIJ79299.1 LuxR family transcriptional regulator [Micromonospora phaseoli]SEJ91104.1 Sugar-specific transcriptional regulator TrmB [Micromonospora phaseoli]